MAAPLAARLLAGQRDWLAWLSAIQIATGLVVLFGMGLITWRDALGVDSMSPVQRVLLGLLLPSLLLGVSFPVLLRLGVPTSQPRGADDGSRGKLVGRFYGVNVLGAIAGSLAGGFLLMPTIGTRLSIVVLAGVFVATGLALWRVAPTSRPDDRPGRGRPRAFGVLAPTAPGSIRRVDARSRRSRLGRDLQG